MIINSCTAGLLHKWNFKGLKLLLYWVACHFRKLALHSYNPVSKEAQSSKCLCRSPNMTPPPLGWRFGMRVLCSYAVVVHYGPTETFTFTDIMDQHLHFGLICPIISCYCALFRCNFANLSCAERRLSSDSLSNKPHFFSPFLHLLSWTVKQCFSVNCIFQLTELFSYPFKFKSIILATLAYEKQACYNQPGKIKYEYVWYESLSHDW